MSTITVRIDAEVERALAVLTADGSTRPQAMRLALLHAARAQVSSQTMRESLMLAADPDDLAEASAVLADMNALRAR